MSKPNSPWSIKGVSLEARSAAKEGSRISRQPLGKWLSQVIHKIGELESGTPGATIVPGTTDSEIFVSTAASPSSAATWQEAVVRLEARIAETEERAAAGIQPLDHALERIADRLDSIETYVLRRPRRSYLDRLLRR